MNAQPEYVLNMDEVCLLFSLAGQLDPSKYRTPVVNGLIWRARAMNKETQPVTVRVKNSPRNSDMSLWTS